MEQTVIGNRRKPEWIFQHRPSSFLSIQNASENKELFRFETNGEFQSHISTTIQNEKYIDKIESLSDSHLESLKPVHYYNDFTKQMEYEFLAKDVKKILPELVKEYDDYQ